MSTAGQRPGEEVALAGVAPELAEPDELQRVLDAFGDGLQAERLREADDGGDDGLVLGSVPKPSTNERSIFSTSIGNRLR